jgi:hypothetical protein
MQDVKTVMSALSGAGMGGWGGGGGSAHEDIFVKQKNGYVVIKYLKVILLQTGEGGLSKTLLFPS